MPMADAECYSTETLRRSPRTKLAHATHFHRLTSVEQVLLDTLKRQVHL